MICFDHVDGRPLEDVDGSVEVQYVACAPDGTESIDRVRLFVLVPRIVNERDVRIDFERRILSVKFERRAGHLVVLFVLVVVLPRERFVCFWWLTASDGEQPIDFAHAFFLAPSSRLFRDGVLFGIRFRRGSERIERFVVELTQFERVFSELHGDDGVDFARV